MRNNGLEKPMITGMMEGRRARARQRLKNITLLKTIDDGRLWTACRRPVKSIWVNGSHV